MDKRRSTRTKGFGLVAVLLMAASCSSSSDSGSGTPATLGGSADRADPLAGKVLPITPLLGADFATRKVLLQAVDKLAASCMKDLGYDYIPYPIEEGFNSFDLHFRYGYLTVADAQAFGYGDPDGAAISDLDQRIAAVDDERRKIDGFDEALYGDGSATGDSCYYKSARAVYGEFGDVGNVPRSQEMINLQVESNKAMLASKPVVDAMSAWSKCMAEGGFEFTNWFDARIKFRAQTGDYSPPSDEERAQAVADAKCRVDTDLELTMFNSESEILTAELEDNAGLVETFRDYLAKALDNATTILDGS